MKDTSCPNDLELHYHIERKNVNRFLNFLVDLFVNRRDCYCIQLKQGYARIDEPLTEEILFRHLSGEMTIGSYQLDSNSLVKWLCFDFDPEKLPQPKDTTQKVLTTLLERRNKWGAIQAPKVWDNCIVLEASRYPDPSYHVWVIFLLPVKAKMARLLGLRILELAHLNPKNVEVFPKQDEITPARPFGNFVKLPFGKHQVKGKWSRLLDFETFEPLPFEELENKHGLSFSEEEMAKLEGMETKRNIQTAFELPKTFKKLSDNDEEKTVCFLIRYWREGYRNDLTLSFCGLCIKSGVSYESAKRVIEEICRRTNTPTLDTGEFLSQVDYQYKCRRNIGNLKGSSGIREVIEAIREKEQNKR